MDLLFNNAGIVWDGETELLTLDQWNAILDKGAVGSFAGRDYLLKTRGGKAYDAD